MMDRALSRAPPSAAAASMATRPDDPRRVAVLVVIPVEPVEPLVDLARSVEKPFCGRPPNTAPSRWQAPGYEAERSPAIVPRDQSDRCSRDRKSQVLEQETPPGRCAQAGRELALRAFSAPLRHRPSGSEARHAVSKWVDVAPSTSAGCRTCCASSVLNLRHRREVGVSLPSATMTSVLLTIVHSEGGAGRVALQA
jgi:hypothetical protein